MTGGLGGTLKEWAIPGEYLDDDEEKVDISPFHQNLS